MIIETVELNSLIKMIEKVGVHGFTILNGVTGMGKHGKSVSTSLVDVGDYNMVIVVDEEEVINKLIETVKPFLKKYSGVMFLSNVEIVS